ncbi:hypothetical protein D3C85_1792620 [compost metagenome]
MRRAHLGAARGVLHALNRRTLAGDRPQCSLEVDFFPAGKAQFTGADENQQGELYGHAGELAPVVGVHAGQQFGHSLKG